MTRRTGKSCGCPRQAGAAPGTGSECPLLLSMLSGHCVEDYVGPRSRAPSARPRPPRHSWAGCRARGRRDKGGRGPVGFVRRGTELGATGPGPDPAPRDALHPNLQIRSGLPTPGPSAPGTPLHSRPPHLPTASPTCRVYPNPRPAPPARDPHPWDPESPGPLPAQPERLDPRIPDPGPEPDPLTPETLP